jgi:hypothetical protein
MCHYKGLSFDFAVCQICFAFVKYFFPNFLLIFRVMQFTAIVHIGFLAPCLNFLNFLYAFMNDLGKVFSISGLNL